MRGFVTLPRKIRRCLDNSSKNLIGLRRYDPYSPPAASDWGTGPILFLNL